MEYIKLKDKVLAYISTLPAEVLNTLGIISLHCATIPTLLAMSAGVYDNSTTVDIYVLLYTGLFCFLLKSIIAKDTFSTLINTTGLFVQIVLLSLVVFK
jgi:hypothetical protein